MIVGTLKVQPPTDRRELVLEVLRSVQGSVLAQPGCTGYHIYEEQEPEPAIVLVERWGSQAALTTHIRSEAYRRILAACELSGTPPEFRFDTVTDSQGIELVEQSLKPNG